MHVAYGLAQSLFASMVRDGVCRRQRPGAVAVTTTIKRRRHRLFIYRSFVSLGFLSSFFFEKDCMTIPLGRRELRVDKPGDPELFLTRNVSLKHPVLFFSNFIPISQILHSRCLIFLESGEGTV